MSNLFPLNSLIFHVVSIGFSARALEYTCAKVFLILYALIRKAIHNCRSYLAWDLSIKHKIYYKFFIYFCVMQLVPLYVSFIYMSLLIEVFLKLGKRQTIGSSSGWKSKFGFWILESTTIYSIRYFKKLANPDIRKGSEGHHIPELLVRNGRKSSVTVGHSRS